MRLLYRSLPLICLVLSFTAEHRLSAHCQIPCGIYDDYARVLSMREDADTVQKACRLMGELSGKADAQSGQQFIRWVNNKEIHAEKIIETISNYFLTQRVKPSQSDYAVRLQAHHAVILAAMKAKQNTSLTHAQTLIDAIDALFKYYPEGKET